MFLCAFLQGVFEYIGDLLYIFAELDKHITSQSVLQQHWYQYRGTLKTIKLDPTKYNCSKNDIVQLENICDDLESTLLSGKIFEVCTMEYVLIYYFDQTIEDKFFIIQQKII